eukprot:CAMPEP_0204615958 /NCGR_PEP_ID=MMETSP0717-20131115/3314_1 /ASSEMBLY_ACC=CAM_ASM_000666 /TAXON_ID=230516 /ORGANISM="Chaetoceros curvisetus" /LENGTH=87 /DNA_ID=CAMNT_0051629023 /DNA_START=43 /DNA_END=303 /DNA_ORIENTATION=-
MTDVNVNVSDERKKAQSGGDDDASKKPTNTPAKKSNLGTATIHQNGQQQNPTIQPNASRYQQLQLQQFGRYPPYTFTANAPMGIRMD